MGRGPPRPPSAFPRPKTMTPDIPDDLLTWIRTESPTHDRAGVNRMMDLAQGFFADYSVSMERIPGRDGLGDAILLRAGPERDEPATLVLSHLDTVHPIGTLAELPI